MIFYVKYKNEIIPFMILCGALNYIKDVGGKLYFKKPKQVIQKELFE